MPPVTAVLPTLAATVRLRPADASRVQPGSGLLADRIRTNQTVSLQHGARQLEATGNLHNFRVAARQRGRLRGTSDGHGTTFPFLDSDLYKWLEAVGWTLASVRDHALERKASEIVDLITAAQRDDGYLNTYVQVAAPGHEFEDLEWGHELYCIGHLIQAAVAWYRSVGDERLLRAARHAAGRAIAEFGPSGRPGIPGHPEIEMALVELYRVTGAGDYLDLAQRFIEQRGHGLLSRYGIMGGGPKYWQDHAPVRFAPTASGHAVRQLYLDCGAVDVATETGDRELLAAVVRRWDDMTATRTYLTGGVGSRHSGESFGDPYELPSDQAYAETCAAVAAVMLAWRLLLATGDAKYADAVERTTLNAVLSGVSTDGAAFFYVNPLQRRTHHTGAWDAIAATGRSPWFVCACCPTNVMRFLATASQMLATTDSSGIQLHQYTDGRLEAAGPGGPITLTIATMYPFDGHVGVTINRAAAATWALTLRIPAWCRDARVAVNDERVDLAATDGVLRLLRPWQEGDRVDLELSMPARITVPDSRIDGVRGCGAVERGPLVYCFEENDLPAGADIDQICIEADASPRLVDVPSLRVGGLGLRVAGTLATPVPDPTWPYHDPEAPGGKEPTPRTPVSLLAIPYCLWANRRPGAMRVWVPIAGHASGCRRFERDG